MVFNDGLMGSVSYVNVDDVFSKSCFCLQESDSANVAWDIFTTFSSLTAIWIKNIDLFYG